MTTNYLRSFIDYRDVKGEVSELEGGDTSQGGTHHTGMLQHLLNCLGLPLLLLLGQAAQLCPQSPPLSIILQCNASSLVSMRS